MRRLMIGVRFHMGIRLHGEADIGLTDAFADHLHGDATFQGCGGVGVPQGVFAVSSRRATLSDRALVTKGNSTDGAN